MQINQTHNGQLQRLEFVDLYGETVSVQESSGAQIDGLWLGIEETQAGVLQRRVHLSREQLQILLPHLELWARGGRLHL